MKAVEYGMENDKAIIMLHGGGLSWWNYREQAEMLGSRYHVILPILDGHADGDTPFTTIEDNAKHIIEYIDYNFGGSVIAICGLSLGAQILLEMLSQRRDICKFAFIESALTIPMPVTSALITPIFGLCYSLIKKKWFAQLQFNSLKIQQSLFQDYYRDTCKISKQDMINFLKSNTSYRIKTNLSDTLAKVVIAVGSREQKI